MAETGAIDFFDSFVNACTCCLVSQTTVLFMAAGWFVATSNDSPFLRFGSRPNRNFPAAEPGW
jgi:hypothetical protein